MKNKKRPKPRAKPGPKPDVLKIDMNWREAAKKVMMKRKPPEGWPK